MDDFSRISDNTAKTYDELRRLNTSGISGSVSITSGNITETNSADIENQLVSLNSTISSGINASDIVTQNLLKTVPILLVGNYSSPEDGAVAYTSANSVTCSSFPFTVDSTVCNVLGIMVTNAAGTVTRYVNGHNGISLNAVTNVVTMTGASPFLATDTKYRLILHCQEKGYDTVTTSHRQTIVSADWGSKTTSAVPIIAAAQTLTTSFADLGAAFEIPCSGYSTLGIWIKLTIQQSVGVQLQALAKHTAAGTEEYNLPIETVSSTVVTITPKIVQFPDSNGLYLLKVSLDNVIPYVQLQVKMTTDGGTDGTIDTAYYTLGY